MPKYRPETVTKGKPKPIGGGIKHPNSKTSTNFMPKVQSKGGGHSPVNKDTQ